MTTNHIDAETKRVFPVGTVVELLTVGGDHTGYMVKIARYTYHNGALCFFGYNHGDNPPFLASQIGARAKV